MPDTAGSPSDETLMSHYARGDPVAFDRLFARYERRAHAFLLARVRSPERADDLFQELFLRIHRGRETFRPDGRFAPWFFGIARRVLVDEYRRRGPPFEEFREGFAARGPDPERAFAARESLASLEAELSEEEQAILVAASGRPGLRIDEAAADRLAARHRIQLPDGSQILLRREYRVIFRTPMRWSEGMLLERVYVASRQGGARVSRAA